MNKSNLIKTVLLIFALVIAQHSQAQGGAAAKTHKIADKVYTFTTDGEYTSMFVITDEGVMVFETVNSNHAKALISEIKKITNKPIKYAFHSHNHWDHASGGQVFLDKGAITLAHVEAYEWMVANKGQDMAIPKEAWAGTRKDITLGDVKVELHYLGMNHGMGMTVFLLPKYNLVYIADIVTPNRLPFAIVPDFNIDGWINSLEEVLKMDFDKAVFTHNEYKNPLLGGNKKDVELQLQFIKDLRAGFFAELKKGTNPFMIPKTLKLPKYKHWVGYDDWLEMNIWRILSDAFLGPYPWRPTPAYETKTSNKKD